MLLNKDNILKAVDRKSAVVDMTAEWGGDVRIMVMSLGEKLALYEMVEKNPDKNFLLYWILQCCVDDEGNKLFSAEDEKALEQKDSKSILKLYEEIRKLNNEDVAEDELAKNS